VVVGVRFIGTAEAIDRTRTRGAQDEDLSGDGRQSPNLEK
jgi:hypothetical protein